MRFSILTLGCKTNQAESQYIASELSGAGYKEVPLEENPEICIVNTCTVTSKSDYQSRQLIRRVLKTGAKVIVTGCYAESSEADIYKISNNCLVFKNEKKYQIIDILIKQTSSNTLKLPLRSRPIIKIQEGCNKHCSYCIVSKVRGRSRSRNSESIINEIKGLEEMGYHEIVLTGTDLSSWGHDLKPYERIEDLIEDILSSTSRLRIRLSSLGIKEVSDRLINLIEKSDRICRHLHLSLQSGSKRILKLMNRHYCPEDFLILVKTLKERIKDINIGVDIIVGFPGEGEREFQETLIALKEAKPGYIHVFPYSKRPGTPASQMPDQVDSRIKKMRVKVIKELDRELRNIFLLSQIGKSAEIVVEEIIDEMIKGKSDNYLNILIPVSNIKAIPKGGECLSVSIKKMAENCLIGDVIPCV